MWVLLQRCLLYMPHICIISDVFADLHQTNFPVQWCYDDCICSAAILRSNKRADCVAPFQLLISWRCRQADQFIGDGRFFGCPVTGTLITICPYSHALISWQRHYRRSYQPGICETEANWRLNQINRLHHTYERDSRYEVKVIKTLLVRGRWTVCFSLLSATKFASLPY